MSKKMLIDATHAEETRVVVVDGNKVEEFDFETVNKRQLAGNIYLAKVTRVEPSLQAAFVDYGGNRHGFLAFAEIHPDYYQIPVADRKALLEEERAYARAQDEEENRRARRPRPQPKAQSVEGGDEVRTAEIGGMDVVDLGDETGADALVTEVPEAVTAVEAVADDQPHLGHDHSHDHAHSHDDSNGEKAYRAIDHASDTDDEIESIAEEDVAEEISAPRKPRPRRYKIQEVVKVRQIMLVQVVKEERGNKGAALTTYLSLAGRYCVLMPNTARGGGISRKITNAADRKKLKEIAGEMDVPEGAGLIVRTAGAKRTKPEIKRDYEYLMRLWEEIRQLTLKSIAPAQIYEEGNLIKRTIRDLHSREIEEILVEGEAGYRTAKDFMRMIMPAQARDVKRYEDPTPLFARYQVEGYLGGMFNPVVQLKSGGYIVIGVTEALVAIDVNSGRATKEGSIEETALKTNLEAAEEIARQLRLRDLAGLIVIDFIDMEERRHNTAVEKKLKDKLKTDRARIQVGRISGFGLMEMSRQRLRPGMLESTTQPCSHCHGTGLIRSDDSLGLQVLRALEEEGTRKRSKEVLLKAPIGIVNFLINQKREHIALIEARYGMSVRIEADPALVSPDYSIEKFKTATRVVPEQATVISGNASLMGAPVEEEDEDIVEAEIIEDEDEAEAPVAVAAAPVEDKGEGPSKKKRRRRRRRKPGSAGQAGANGVGADDEADGDVDGEDDGEEADGEDGVTEAPVEAVAVVAEAVAEVAVEVAPVTKKPSSRAKSAAAKVADAEAVAAKPKATRSRSTKAKAEPVAEDAVAPVAEVTADVAAEDAAPAKKTVTRTRKAPAKAPAKAVKDVPVVAEATPAVAETPAPVLQPDPGLEPAPVTVALRPDPQDAPAATDKPDAPKRKGWWSLGR
ncbi:Rne/Rng family ribonuclease [Fuscibacter oryzae]|uniref:Ribonuclease E n=1 Tax=Fuscibacter oryzae TaxID=2803939 RepID=A0A8J7MLT5_9RHOB|nr:ribonuclease E/G [Fuscibacter oryzae]MBL4927150.1 Rne/Rng family ribonuclease [Fuscibacter oryzae]